MGKQVLSSQRSEPAFSFGGGKSFDMHEHNMKGSLGFAKRASARRKKKKKKKGQAGRQQQPKTKKEEADELFRKFFGYDPGDATKKGRHALVSKRKKAPRPQTTPGPGQYTLPSTMGPSRTRLNAPSFSFPTD